MVLYNLLLINLFQMNLPVSETPMCRSKATNHSNYHSTKVIPGHYLKKYFHQNYILKIHHIFY